MTLTIEDCWSDYGHIRFDCVTESCDSTVEIQPEETIECQLCGREYDISITITPEQREYPYTCAWCGKGFDKEADKREHINEEHYE